VSSIRGGQFRKRHFLYISIYSVLICGLIKGAILESVGSENAGT